LKVLVLSDIHGNLDAMNAVLEEADKLKWKELWFLGDISGYGPEPDKCFTLLQSLKVVYIPGNHDLYYAGKLSRSFFSREALQALLLTGTYIRPDFIAIMKGIPLMQRRKGITMVHGSIIDPSREYILTKDQAEKNFDILKGDCCLFGHTHWQGCFIKDKNTVTWIKPEIGETVSYRKKRILINPGSVGQPRDKDPGAAWAILDMKKKEVQFFRTEYDISATQKKMRAMGSSEFLIKRLETGQ